MVCTSEEIKEVVSIFLHTKYTTKPITNFHSIATQICAFSKCINGEPRFKANFLHTAKKDANLPTTAHSLKENVLMIKSATNANYAKGRGSDNIEPRNHADNRIWKLQVSMHVAPSCDNLRDDTSTLYTRFDTLMWTRIFLPLPILISKAPPLYSPLPVSVCTRLSLSKKCYYLIKQ